MHVEYDATNRPAGRSRLLGAILIGAAAGAVVALLSTPKRGEETREFLGKKLRAGQDRAQRAARASRDVLDRERSRVSQAVKQGSAQLGRLARRIDPMVEEGRASAERVLEHGRQVVDDLRGSAHRVAG